MLGDISRKAKCYGGDDVIIISLTTMDQFIATAAAAAADIIKTTGR